MSKDDDKLWKEMGERNGWSLPPKPVWWMMLPIIRNFRALWLGFMIERHYRYGPGSIGAFRTGYDEWVHYAVAKGWA